MKRKLTALLLALCMVTAVLASCGNGPEESTTDGGATTTDAGQQNGLKDPTEGLSYVEASRKIYEDEDFQVMLDVSPATKGHALILPKKHYANLYELPEEEAKDVIVLAKKMAAKMTEKLGCDGFNLVQNNGETAGQTVFHFHMHLIPRYKEDGQKIGWNPGSPSQEELEEIKNQILS